VFVVHVHVAQSIEELVGSDLQSVGRDVDRERDREREREGTGERVCKGYEENEK
jgi:hypothetical protein